VTVASYPPRCRAGVPSVPNSRHAMGGAGAGFVVDADRIPVAWPSRRRHRRDEVRTADGNTQALRSCLEDNEVPEAAHEAGCGI
jgi:hypothetical protein